jgi:transposase
LADGEIFARVDPRRRWTAQEKAALLAEVEAAGGKVKIVARRHRISASLLYNWRAARKAAATAMPPAFIRLGVLGGSSHLETAMPPRPREPQPPRPVRADDHSAGGIEIVLPNGARVSVDAFVNEKALSRVLRAMKGVT